MSGGEPEHEAEQGPTGGISTVARNNWVSLSYRLHDSDGEPIEELARRLVYLHGVQDALFPKIEQALEGLPTGARISLYLEPQDSFGDYDAQRIHLVDRKRLPPDVEEGMAFEGLPGQGLYAEDTSQARVGSTIGNAKVDAIVASSARVPCADGDVDQEVLGDAAGNREDENPLIYTVTDLSDEVAVLDGNHPLAGMALRFDIEVREVWEATPDEIEEARTAP